MAAPPDVVDDLYGLPLAEFIPARDARAKELRAAGHKDGAAEVKAARKPSLAAWALNQAARRHPDDVARLLAAGSDLAEAQRAAVAGDASGLRDAGRALAEQVDRVADLAAGLLDNASGVQRDRITATLRAAAADEAGADLLRRGVLVEDLEAAGFGLVGFDALAAGPPGRPPTRPKAPAGRNRQAAEALEAARRELRRAEADAEAAETRARRRAERAETAARRAAEAHREAEALRAEAEEAAREATTAQRQADEAAARVAEAEAQAG